MKKITSFFATIAAVAALSACSQDDSPVLLKPTEFKLNTPPFAEQLYQLTEDGQITFTCSQPDYGLGVETTYSLDISLTEDFADFRSMSLVDPLSATLTFSAASADLAILEMLGVSDEETWAPYADNRVMPLYVRATAQTAQVEYSKITSNVVKLPNVEIYFAIKMPGYIYLVGNPEGWVGPDEANAEHYKDWRLFENEAAIGSNVYSAVFTMPAQPIFRFYTALTGWDADSYGSQVDDNPIDVALVDGSLETGLVKGKGSFSFPDFEGGEMTVTVDMNAMTVKFEAGAVEVHPTTYIYMVGNQAGWAEPSADNQAVYDNWRLTCSDGTGVYKATFAIDDLGMDGANPQQNLYCRFYKQLSGWGPAQWASTTDADFEVNSGVEYDSKSGEGCFMLKDALDKNVSVEVDSNTNKVKFTFVD